MSVKAVKLIQPGEIQGMPDDDTPLLVVVDAAETFRARAGGPCALACDPCAQVLHRCNAVRAAMPVAVRCAHDRCSSHLQGGASRDCIVMLNTQRARAVTE